MTSMTLKRVWLASFACMFLIILSACILYLFLPSFEDEAMEKYKSETYKIILVYRELYPTINWNLFPRNNEFVKLIYEKNEDISKAPEKDLQDEPSVKDVIKKLPKDLFLSTAMLHTYCNGVAYELSESAKEEFLSALTLGHMMKGVSCGCSGNPEVILFSKNKVLTFFSIHHSENIRWGVFPSGDIQLTSSSSSKLEKFFKKCHLPLFK